MSKIPLLPFEKILKEADSDIRVSEAATKEFVEVIDEIARKIAKDAAQFAKHAKRKTVMQEDIKLAKNMK